MNHNTNSSFCACNPSLLKLCPECEGERCPLCSMTGVVTATKLEAEPNSSTDVLIIHREGPDDEIDPSRETAIIQAINQMAERKRAK